MPHIELKNLTNTWSSAGTPGFWSTSNAFFASPCYIKKLRKSKHGKIYMCTVIIEK